MASVYILYSSSSDKYYVGFTRDLKQRFEYHLVKEFAKGFTAKYSDWEIYYEIPDLSVTTARNIESHIKKMKSKKYLQNLKKFPGITERLISRFS